MRIAILGASGSGKGTQAKLLAKRYRVPRISVGGLLRAAVAADDNKLDNKTKEAVAARQPVAFDVVMALLEERLRARDSKRGFIIDDFPGDIPQAQALDALLGIHGGALQIVAHLKVDDDTLMRRITGRQGCDQCGAAYNRHFSPPQIRGKCDNCGGKVVSESRSNARTALRKIKEYNRQTAPLLAYYKAQHKLRTVAAIGKVAEIEQKICDIVDLEIRPLEITPLETAAQTHDEEISTVIVGGQISRITNAPETPARSMRTTVQVAAKNKTTDKRVAKKTANKPVSKTATKKKAAKKVSKKVPTPNKSPLASKKKTAAKNAASKKRPVCKVGKKSAAKSPARKTAKKKVAKKKPAKKTKKQ